MSSDINNFLSLFKGNYKEIALQRELESAKKIKKLYKYQICDILRDFINPYLRVARDFNCNKIEFYIKNSKIETLLNPLLARFEIVENLGKVYFRLEIGKEFLFFNLKENRAQEDTFCAFALNSLRDFGKEKKENVMNLILQNLKASGLEIVMSDYDFKIYHLFFTREGFSSDYTPFYSWLQLCAVRDFNAFFKSSLLAKSRTAKAWEQKETLFVTN